MSDDKKSLFLTAWKMIGEPIEPTEEYCFAKKETGRKWRFDFAFIPERVAVEVNGNAWNVRGGGRHNQEADYWKLNNAAALGWRILYFSPAMLINDPAGCVGIVNVALKFSKR